MTHNETSWLKNTGGYRYYASISYPGEDTQLIDLARTIQYKLSIELGRDLPRLRDPPKAGESPFVFTANSHLSPGVTWESKLAESLCQSLIMIVLAVPAYAFDKHQYCGKEFKFMQSLSISRLGTEEAIFPIILSKEDLRTEISRLQGFDFTQIRRLVRITASKALQQCVMAALDHVQRVGRRLVERQAKAENCESVVLPPQSAFPPSSVPELPNREILL